MLPCLVVPGSQIEEVKNESYLLYVLSFDALTGDGIFMMIRFSPF